MLDLRFRVQGLGFRVGACKDYRGIYIGMI